MITKVRLCIRLLVLAVSALSFSLQAATPTPEQIAQFKKLPKAQQQALAKQYGFDMSVLSSSNNPADTADMTEAEEQFLPRTGEDQKLLDLDAELEQRLGIKAPKPFGYDVFANQPTTFSPNLSVAIPEGYILAPGDTLSIQIYGKENYEYQQVITREGQVVIPNLGPFTVSGLSFSKMRELLEQKIKEKILGVDVAITLSELRTIRVFVLGDAYQPGQYNLSSLSTITHALFAAGGISDIGSLRDIQLKRQGKLIKHLDLYDLLVYGDSQNDVMLQSGDVVFVAPVGKSMTVSGEVKRPAIYELTGEETFEEIVKVAGGFLPSAHRSSIVVERINDKGVRTVVSLDMTSQVGQKSRVRDGDYLKVMKNSEQFDKSVTIIGAASRPGNYQWLSGQRVSDLLPDIDTYLLSDADLQYSIVVREVDKARNIEVHQISLANAINYPQSEDNILLFPKDKILVFSHISSKKQQGYSLDKYAYTYDELVSKEVKALKEDFQVKRYASKYEAAEHSILYSELAETEDSEEVDFQSSINELTGAVEEEFSLGDAYVFSRQKLLDPVITKLKQQGASGKPIQLVEVVGAVKFPGIYPLAVNGEVDDLLAAAGGLLESAYIERAELTRNIFDELQIQKESISLNLGDILSNNSSQPFYLQSKDRLNVFTIPAWQENQVVELRGEFLFPGKYTIRRGETLDQLIQRAGGFTDFANIKGSLYTRDKLKKLEQQNLLNVTSDLRMDIASKSLTSENGGMQYEEANKLLSDLAKVKPLGRLVIDLEAVVENRGVPIMLEHGDMLYVPSHRNSVSVMGEVYRASSHVFQPASNSDDYIQMSGGMKKRADVERIYIIAANGSVKHPGDSSWFNTIEDEIEPGDTIVVPLDSEYVDDISLWQTATQIIYQSAVAIAAIGSL